MTTLLMVESWLHSTGLSLPPLIRAMGHRYVLLTREPSLYALDGHGGSPAPHPVIRDADEVVVVDTNDTPATVRAAGQIARRRRIDGVVTTCDYYLGTVASVAAALGLPGGEPEAMRMATRKHLVREALHTARVPDAAFDVAHDWPATRKAASQLGYPLVAKPVDANSGTSVRLVADEAELQTAFTEITGPSLNSRGQPRDRLVLLEQVLDGPEFSVEAVTRDGRTDVVAITAKTVFGVDTLGQPGYVEAGHLVPAPLAPPARAGVEHLVAQALDAVGIRHGLSHIEIKLTEAGPRIVEINPRQGGGYIFDLVHLTTGSNPLEMLVDLALGQSPRPSRPQATSAAVAFVTSPVDGLLRGVQGTEGLDADHRVVRWELTAHAQVHRPADNNARLGYVLTADPHGHQAKDWADAVVAGLRLDVDGHHVHPLSPRPGSSTRTP